jgi:hypothetical protein
LLAKTSSKPPQTPPLSDTNAGTALAWQKRGLREVSSKNFGENKSGEGKAQAEGFGEMRRMRGS